MDLARLKFMNVAKILKFISLARLKFAKLAEIKN